MIKRLENAEVGEYFRFVTSTGKVYFLECIGFTIKTRYNYNEWCVSEQTYEEKIPQFKRIDGKKVFFQGNAELMTKEEYDALQSLYNKLKTL